MADIFREVDEEVRQDRVQLFVSRYWGWMLIALLIVIAGVGGWRGYEYWRLQQAQDAGGRYLDALKLARDGKGPEAISALDELGRSGNTGYGLLARFRAASQTGLADPAGGAKAFDTLSADGTLPPAFQDIARLRAAILLADTIDLKEMRRRVESLADANNPMRNPARELLAISALKTNAYDDAGKWLDAIVTDPTATASARQRAEAFLGLVRSGKTATP